MVVATSGFRLDEAAKNERLFCPPLKLSAERPRIISSVPWRVGIIHQRQAAAGYDGGCRAACARLYAARSVRRRAECVFKAAIADAGGTCAYERPSSQPLAGTVPAPMRRRGLIHL